MDIKKVREKKAIPCIILGTWQITDRETLSTLIDTAFREGYSAIDTAAAYFNELSIVRILKNYRIAREKIFLQSKVWNTNRGFLAVQEACKQSLKKLKTDYLNSYLIHWPASPKFHKNWAELNAETWRGMEELQKEGLVHSIGVCNFKAHHLFALEKTARVLPEILQIEFHIGMNTAEMAKVRDFCAQKNIILQASSPLGNGQILKNEMLSKLAKKYRKSVAQIALKYALQNKFCVIPKTAHCSRLKENIDIFDFSLSEDEMKMLDKIEFCGGLNIDSDEVVQFE